MNKADEGPRMSKGRSCGSEREEKESLMDEEAEEIYTTINVSGGASREQGEEANGERPCETFTYGMTQFGQLGIGYTNKKSTPLPTRIDL